MGFQTRYHFKLFRVSPCLFKFVADTARHNTFWKSDAHRGTDLLCQGLMRIKSSDILELTIKRVYQSRGKGFVDSHQPWRLSASWAVGGRNTVLDHEA